MASQNYICLRMLLRETRTPSPLSLELEETELIRQLVPATLIDSALLTKEQVRGVAAPVSDRIQKLLREPLRPLIPGDEAYDSAFDRFEYLFTLVWYDMERVKRGSFRPWAPVGRFMFRNRGFGGNGRHISEVLTLESETERDSWPVIREGLFPSSEAFSLLHDAYKENILSRNSGWL